MSSEAGQENPKAKQSIFFRALLFPIRATLSILLLIFLFLLILAVLAPILLFGILAIEFLLFIFDLIFRTHIQNAVEEAVNNFGSNYIEPILIRAGGQIQTWLDQFGLTPIFLSIFDSLANIASEIVRGLILFCIFLVAGFAVYHLRIVRRIIYALLELVVAVIAMWIAIDGMSGGDFSLKYVVALLSGLYIMIRGLQNADEGLREFYDIERKAGIERGPGEAWLRLWRAIFYDRYTAKSLPTRAQEVKAAGQIVWANIRRARKPDTSQADNESASETDAAHDKSDPPHDKSDPRFGELNERIIAEKNENLRREVVGRRYTFVFNPVTGGSKMVTFGEEGNIGEGRNSNEYKWRIRDGRLEIIDLHDKLYSRFLLTPAGRLEHTNDPDTRSIKGQFLVPVNV